VAQGGQGPLLRPACSADHAALIAILRETFRDTWAPQMRPEAIEHYDIETRSAGYVETSAAAFVVAELDGKIAGFIHWAGDFVHALHVSATARRSGVGRALMEMAEREIRQAGLGRVRLETDTFNGPSQALYRALGYREIDRYPDIEYDPDITTVLLEKLL